MEMFRRVLILRGIATAHVTALHAEPEVDPLIAHFQAFLASPRVGVNVMYLLSVRALLHVGGPVSVALAVNVFEKMSRLA